MPKINGNRSKSPKLGLNGVSLLMYCPWYTLGCFHILYIFAISSSFCQCSHTETCPLVLRFWFQRAATLLSCYLKTDKLTPTMKTRNTKIRNTRKNRTREQTLIPEPEPVIPIPETRTRNFYNTRTRSENPKFLEYPRNPT